MGPHKCQDYTEACHRYCHACQALLAGINWLRQLLNWQRVTWDMQCSAADFEFEYERLMDHHWPGRTTHRRLKASTTQTQLGPCNDWDTPKQSSSWPSATEAYNVFQCPVIEVYIDGVLCNVRVLPAITGYGYMEAHEGRLHNRKYLVGANYIAGLFGRERTEFFEVEEVKYQYVSPADLLGSGPAQLQLYQNETTDSQGSSGQRIIKPKPRRGVRFGV